VNNNERSREPELERIATGVPGLDEVLKGGFFEGAVYIVRGTPGAGKTILANQICFQHARRGKRALFVTLLAENHARMLQHLEQMSFYDARLIPKYVYYISAFRVLEENGLKGMMELLRREMRAHEASILILDGLIAVEETSTSDREFRKFIHELQAHAAAAGCCTLLLTNGRRGEYHPEHTMVDGLVTLEDVPYGKRRQRELEVRKFRGSASLRGRHPFQITDDGLVVHPRPESRFLRNTGIVNADRISTGIAQLDTMTGGGLIAGSSTLLLGPSGAGKTTLGLVRAL
jgi:circadian clock protein KaiC